MTRYAMFLRGVNVGGINLKMADVAAALTNAGFANVRTIAASGNVVLESGSDVAVVRSKAQEALRERFGYEAWVLAYDVDIVRTIVDAFPYDRDVDGYQSYVTFVADAAVLQELTALAAVGHPAERISSGDGVIYWQVPIGSTRDSTIGQTMGKRRYKASTTTRNLRTLAKVLR